MQHKLLIYTYDKSVARYSGISPDNFADKKIHCMPFIPDKINKYYLTVVILIRELLKSYMCQS